MRPFLRPGVIFSQEREGCDAVDLVDLRHLRMSASAYDVLARCDGKRTLEDLTGAPSGAPEAAAPVRAFIEALIAKDILLPDPPAVPHPARWAPPGVVFLELTRACNLQCVWCYNDSHAPLPRELDTSEWKACIDRLAEHPGTLLFTGGEPLARRDALEIAAHARSRGFGTQLFTNGTLVTSRNARAIAETFDYVRITIDGATAATNDAVRGAGSFDRALAGLRSLVELGVRVCWQTIVSRHNLHELPRIVEKAIEVGASGLRMASMDPLGRGCATRDLELTAEQEFVFWRFMAWAAEEHKKRIQLDWGADYCLEEAWDTIMSTEPGTAPTATPQGRRDPDVYMRFARTSPCGVGVRSFLINPEGFIGVCPLLAPPDVNLGNVRERDLLDAWYEDKLFATFRARTLEDFDHCGACGVRYRCQGGCRGRAFHLTGRFTGCDDKMLRYLVVPAPEPLASSPSP